MIYLDSCAVLDMLFDENEAHKLSKYLDLQQSAGKDVLLLDLNLLESACVVAVRFKEGKNKSLDLDDCLAYLDRFQTRYLNVQESSSIILEAARIKSEHAASMVDCYLIAKAVKDKAEVITADAEILKYRSKRANIHKITTRHSSIRWRG
jgi:predicted nucleic acid-binding protein